MQRVNEGQIIPARSRRGHRGTCWLPVHWLLLQRKCYSVPKLPAKHFHKGLLVGASLFQQESGSAAQIPRGEALNLTGKLLAGPGAVLGQDVEWWQQPGGRGSGLGLVLQAALNPWEPGKLLNPWML